MEIVIQRQYKYKYTAFSCLSVAWAAWRRSDYGWCFDMSRDWRSSVVLSFSLVAMMVSVMTMIIFDGGNN